MSLRAVAILGAFAVLIAGCPPADQLELIPEEFTASSNGGLSSSSSSGSPDAPDGSSSGGEECAPPPIIDPRPREVRCSEDDVMQLADCLALATSHGSPLSICRDALDAIAARDPACAVCLRSSSEDRQWGALVDVAKTNLFPNSAGCLVNTYPEAGSCQEEVQRTEECGQLLPCPSRPDEDCRARAEAANQCLSVHRNDTRNLNRVAQCFRDRTHDSSWDRVQWRRFLRLFCLYDQP